MTLFAESADKVYGDIITELSNNTNLTRFSRGSAVRQLALAVSKKMGRMWSDFDLNVAQSFINGAQGKFLSYLGDMLGVPRLGEESARITLQSRSIRFYTNTGTFGSINGGNSITIPAGKIISTVTGNAGIQYRITSSQVLLSSNSEQYVEAEAVSSGSDSNVGKGQLNFHDFIGYSDVTNNTLKVTNDSDITGGKDSESDANYRYRIANQIFAAQYANEIAVRLAALSVAGVADVTMVRHFKGVGTFELLIKSTVPEISDDLIANVRDRVTSVTSFGNIESVRGPLESGVSLVGTLYLRRRLSAQEESDLIRGVTNNVIDHINSLDIGETLIVNDLVQKALGTAEVITKVGTTAKPFDNLYLYKQSVVDGGKARQKLLTDYVPESDERLIVETVYGGDTPILFRTSL